MHKMDSQSDNQAIPPSNITISFKNIYKEQQDTYKRLQEEDEVFWANLPKDPIFPRLKNFFMRLIEELDVLEGEAFFKGAPLQEIGLRRTVNRLTKANLLSFINKAEKTAEAVNARKQKQSGQARG